MSDELREAAQVILDRCLDFFGEDDLEPDSSEAMPVVIKNRWVYDLRAALAARPGREQEAYDAGRLAGYEEGLAARPDSPTLDVVRHVQAVDGDGEMRLDVLVIGRQNANDLMTFIGSFQEFDAYNDELPATHPRVRDALRDPGKYVAEAPERPAPTHGRHCACSACAREDWTRTDLAFCGIHGPLCPPVYDPWGPA